MSGRNFHTSKSHQSVKFIFMAFMRVSPASRWEFYCVAFKKGFICVVNGVIYLLSHMPSEKSLEENLSRVKSLNLRRRVQRNIFVVDGKILNFFRTNEV